MSEALRQPECDGRMIFEGRAPLFEHEIKALAMRLAMVMPRQVLQFEPSTGEVFSHAALELARTYDRATRSQQSMLDTIVAGFKRG